MIEFLKHILGLCGEPPGLLFWIITGTSVMVIAPLKELYYKLVRKEKKE